MGDKAEEMRNRIFSSGSYEEALGIILEYVDDETMVDDYDEEEF